MSIGWTLAARQGWIEPLARAAHAGPDIALLYSGLREGVDSTRSFLFAEPLEVREGSSWEEMPPSDAPGDLPEWVGYLGYGMRNLRQRGADAPIIFSDFRLIRYARLWVFDHEARTMEEYSRDGSVGLPRPARHKPAARVSTAESNFSREAYVRAVERTLEQIRAGNFYQANITRKFFGRLAESCDTLALFARLSEASPAPYSAFIRHGEQAILSSSPECFLSVDAEGGIITRPIKGSARRSDDEAEDAAIRSRLAASDKNLAENLMIVDLMRNDLARVCEPGSVTVDERAGLYSYATIHHLISTIRGEKRPDASIHDAVRACFPPGSMTGAPKIAAVRWCEETERMERGVYSGAIGWFAKDSCDLSVVIRTLLVEGDRFEFQVGGGIVADSTPEEEWRETLAKARGILLALGLEEETIAGL